MNQVWIGVIGYLSLQFAIGIGVSRRIHNEQDYLIAGRRLGLILAAVSIFATWFGAETVIGAAGAIYRDGLTGGSADPFGYVLCILAMGIFFAATLWRRGYTTFADFFRDRYSVTVERLAILLMIPPSVFWAAAQIRAFGQVLSAASGMDISWSITTATILVIAYTAVGGLLADAWTDLVQGLTLILGLIVMAMAVVTHAPVTQLFRELPAERLRLFTVDEAGLLAVVERWSVPVLGSMLAIEIISRVLACKSPSTARKACLLGGSLYLIVGLIPVGLGLLGPQLYPNLEEPEQLIPRLSEAYMGSFFFAAFSGALVSAILSTVDSALLAASGLISHNLIAPLLPKHDERRRVLLARLCVALLGGIAYLLAVRSSTIYDLVETASAFGSSGIVVVTCLGLSSRFGGPASAIGALLCGALVWFWGDMVGWTAPFLTSLLAALGVYAILALAGSQTPATHSLASQN